MCNGFLRCVSVFLMCKTIFRNRLGSKNLKAMLRITLEGPDEVVDDIVSDNVPLWKNDSKYHFFVCKSLLLFEFS